MQHPSQSLPTLGIPEASAIVHESVFSVVPIGQGIRSRVFRVETDEGTVRVVRITPKGTGRVEREAWVRAHLKKHPDVPLLPELAVTDVPLAQSVDIVTMAELPGTTMYTATRTMFEPEARALYERFGAGLAAIHSVSVDGFGLLDAGGHGPYASWSEAFEAIAHAGLEEARMSPLNDMVPEAERVIATLSPGAIDASSAPRLLHGDAQPGNVQVHRGRIVAFLDFEFASGGDPDYELALVEALFEPSPAHPVSDSDLAERRTAFRRGYGGREIPPERMRLYRLVHALRGTEFLSVVGSRLAAPARDEHTRVARAQLRRWLNP